MNVRVFHQSIGNSTDVFGANRITIEIDGQEIEITPIVALSGKRWINLSAKNGEIIVKPTASNSIDIEVDID